MSCHCAMHRTVEGSGNILWRTSVLEHHFAEVLAGESL